MPIEARRRITISVDCFFLVNKRRVETRSKGEIMRKEFSILMMVSILGVIVSCGQNSDSLNTGWGQATAVPSVPCQPEVSYEYHGLQLVSYYRLEVCKVRGDYRTQAAWVLEQAAKAGQISCKRLNEDFLRVVTDFVRDKCQHSLFWKASIKTSLSYS
jgi:hypothetical protein